MANTTCPFGIDYIISNHIMVNPDECQIKKIRLPGLLIVFDVKIL